MDLLSFSDNQLGLRNHNNSDWTGVLARAKFHPFLMGVAVQACRCTLCRHMIVKSERLLAPQCGQNASGKTIGL